MRYKTAKINFVIARSFSFGFTIFSPKLNGFCVEVALACFLLRFHNRGEYWFRYANFWDG